jgi:hypothetical protein
MPDKLADMSGFKNAVKKNTLNAALQTLIDAIWAGAADLDIYGKNVPLKTFFNHGDNRDPASQGGATPGDVTVWIYYQPATQAEYNNYDTIDEAGFLSGRKRLAVRKEAGRCGGDDLWSFYTTNHPKPGPTGKNNNYGAYTPIDMS